MVKSSRVLASGEKVLLSMAIPPMPTRYRRAAIRPPVCSGYSIGSARLALRSTGARLRPRTAIGRIRDRARRARPAGLHDAAAVGAEHLAGQEAARLGGEQE